MSRIRKDAGRHRPPAPPYGVEGAPPRPVDTPAAPPSLEPETRCPFLAENQVEYLSGVRYYDTVEDMYADWSRLGLPESAAAVYLRERRRGPWWKRLLRWLDERAD